MTDFVDISSPVSHDDALLAALFMAAVIHVVLLFSLNFSFPKPDKIARSIEITIANTPAKKAPKKAEFLAQSHQVGAGSENSKPKPAKLQLPSPQQGHKKQGASEQRTNLPKKVEKRLTAVKSEIKVNANKKISDSIEKQEVKSKLTAEALQMQIARLGERILQSSKSSQRTKIKFANQVSTHKYIAAQYIKDWENKVERTGNMNYPEVARRKNFFGALIMDVGIKADGSIYSMRITKSSGNQALDDAAKRIVRLSSPFAELPAELLQQMDVLIITRVWKFSDESGMTTR